MEVVVTRGWTMNMVEVVLAVMILAVAIGFVGWVIAGRRAAAAERAKTGAPPGCRAGLRREAVQVLGSLACSPHADRALAALHR